MREVDEIRNILRQAFVQNDSLRPAYGLSLSKNFDEQFPAVSIEALLTDLAARAIYDHEWLLEMRMAGIEAQIGAQIPFSAQWYRQKALEFQKGDALAFNPVTCRFDYPELNEDKRIVKQVALRQDMDANGLTVLKVYAAKEGREKLNPDEIAAFSGYIREIGAAGTHFVFISENPVKVVVECIVYYDPQVLDSTGNTLRDGTNPVRLAVDEYTKNIPYSGRFSASKCVDAIQSVAGVLDVHLKGVKIDGVLQNPFFYSSSGFFEATVSAEYSAQINLWN
jgi:hypothetical protein